MTAQTHNVLPSSHELHVAIEIKIKLKLRIQFHICPSHISRVQPPDTVNSTDTEHLPYQRKFSWTALVFMLATWL